MLINVLTDWGGDINAAIAHAKPGDALYLPAKQTSPNYYQATAAGGFLIDKPLEIYGDGTGDVSTLAGGTAIAPYVDYSVSPHIESDYVFIIKPGVGFVYIHDLKIVGSGNPNIPFRPAIYCKSTGYATNYIRLERVAVVSCGSDGIYLDGDHIVSPQVGTINDVSIRDCTSIYNRGHGIFLQDVTVGYVLGTETLHNYGAGIHLSRAQDIRLIANWVENNQQNHAGGGGDPVEDPQLYIRNSAGFLVSACHFEAFDQTHSANTAVVVKGSTGGCIEASEFINNGIGVGGSRSVLIIDDPTSPLGLYTSYGIRVGPNDHYLCDTLVEIDNGSANTTNCIVEPQAVRFATSTARAQIVVPDINDGGNYVYVPSSLTSNIGAGLILPSVSSVPDPVGNPAVRRGALVYQGTANRLMVFTGTSSVARLNYDWQTVVGKVGTEQTLFDQSASIAATNLFTNYPAGMYRVSIVMACRAASANPVYVEVYLGWYDRRMHSRSLGVGGKLYLTQVAADIHCAVPIMTDGSLLSFSTIVTGAIGAGLYDLFIRVEAL